MSILLQTGLFSEGGDTKLSKTLNDLNVKILVEKKSIQIKQAYIFGLSKGYVVISIQNINVHSLGLVLLLLLLLFFFFGGGGCFHGCR